MSLLLRHRKLGIPTTFRIDEPELEELARDLHSSAMDGEARCSDGTPADLIWKSAGNGWNIILKGVAWGAGSLRKDDLFLQSDSLIDDLVRERLTAYPLLHAAAVANNCGRVAVICGGPGAGKTSLATEAVLRGYRWLSDELLCFRQSDPLIAEGFRRDFNIKEHSFANFPQILGTRNSREFASLAHGQRIRFFNPDLLFGGQYASAGRVQAIFLPEYSNVAKAFAIPVKGPELVDHLAPELRTTNAQSITWLAEVTRIVPAFTLRYHRPDDAVDCLFNLWNRL